MWVFSDIVEEALGVASTAGEVVVISCAPVSFSNSAAQVLGPQPRLWFLDLSPKGVVLTLICV